MQEFAWLILLLAAVIVAAYFYLKRRQQVAGPADTADSSSEIPAADRRT
ncbi:MAG: hypothetical protein ACRDG7_16300 [Candidatus Limnocylindria bacterium]